MDKISWHGLCSIASKDVNYDILLQVTTFHLRRLEMKAKGLLTAVLLVASNFAWAQGGLSVDNVEQHMSTDDWIDTKTTRPDIATQGPIDKFNVEAQSLTIDTRSFMHSYDGYSELRIVRDDLISRKPNIIRKLRRKS